jgi:predicted flap endonuclease-1-like 5' DNA nuclease
LQLQNSENYLNCSIEHTKVREKPNMRSDYALYGVAVILFVITIITYMALPGNLSIIATAIIGLLFIGIGYTQRPKTQATTVKAPSPPPPPAPPTEPLPITAAPSTAMEAVKEEKPGTVTEVTAASPTKELTQVKGIKEKRSQQLGTLGISSVEDLAKASAKDLAEKLKISPKITERWIENAKELLEK